MSDELKPCPFCHDSAYPQDSNPYSKRGYWAVICSNCEAEGPAANNEIDAIALWNRRSDMAVALENTAPTEAELKSANYLNEISGPGFMHRQHLAPINALVQRILAAWNTRRPTPEQSGEALSPNELSALLPGSYYMDPPDGGSVTLLEQLQRMAHDAGRYRWLRGQADGVVTSDQLQDIICGKWADEWDAAIDAAMDRSALGREA